MKKLFFSLGYAMLCLFQITDLQAQNNDLFKQFSWLTNLVTPSNCTNEKVEVYQSFLYDYILLTDANGVEKLYNADGQFYCQNASNYDCIAAYRLTGPTASWSCGSAINCEEEALIRRLQNSGTNCYSIAHISKIEYEGSNYYLPISGTTLGDLLRNGSNPCGVLENFPSMYDCEGRRVCEFGFTAPPCPIVRGEGMFVWTNEEIACEVEDPFSVDIIQRSITEDRFLLQGSDTCKYVKEIIQFDYQGFTFFRVNEAQYAPSNCQSAVASRFYSCTGDFVGGVGNAPNCQNAIVCENLDLNSRSGAIIWSFEENQSNCDTQDPLSLPALQTAINTPPRINTDGSICWYIKHIIEFQYEGKTFYRVVEDANPSQQCSVEWGTLFYTCEGELIGGTGIYPACDDAALCVYDIPTLNVAANSSGTILWDSGIGNNEQDKIFEDFPWLTDLVNPNTCSSEKIEIYGGNAQHPYNYLLVTDANGNATLYNTGGQVYCVQTPTNICIDAYVNAYGISRTPFRTWTCASTNCVCPQVVIPVCGVDGNTYTNSCEAVCAGVAVAFDSPCNIDPPSLCSITITNTQCRTVGIYDEADNLLVQMNGAYGGLPPAPIPNPEWIDTRPLTANETRTYIFKDSNLEIGRQTLTCNTPTINVVSKYFSGCTDAVGLSQLTNVGCRDLQVFGTRGNLLQSATQGETVSLTVLDRIYILMAGMDTLAIGHSFGNGNIDTKGCTEDAPCLVTITNNECRRVGIYDEDNNLLVTMRSAPIPNSPLSINPQQWTDSRPLSLNTTRTYIFKEDNLVLGRQTVSCDNKDIEVVSNYFNACTDAIFSSELTNIGCRVIQIFDTNGDVVGTAAAGEVFQLQSNRVIYILMAGRDTLAVNLDGTVDSGGCEEGNNNNQIFEDYPWLSDLGNPNTCTIKEIAIWRSGIYTYLLVTDEKGSATLYNENGQFYCQNSANYDCLTAYNLNERIDQWNCSSTATECLVSITNKECRLLRIYDENDVLLTTNGSRPSVIRPNAVWEDTRPLASGESRTYVFKDGLLELGRQIVTCANPNISLVNKYDDGCIVDNGQSELTNVGCSLLRVFNSGGGMLGRAFPGEMVSIKNGQYYILMVDKDTIGVELAFGIRDIDTGGCPDRTNYEDVQIFEEYAWLTDVVDRTNCSTKSVEVWQARTTIYLWVVDENGNGTLYNESGQLYCQPTPSNLINCFQSYELRELIAVWVCGEATPPDEMEEETANPAIFNDYPWLTDLVDPNDCTGQAVEMWKSGIHTYFLVTNAFKNQILYDENGQLYCRSTPTYDCRQFYGLTEFVDDWTCSDNNCACPQVIDPVCGIDGKTYNNSCEAACAGVNVASDEACLDCRTASLVDIVPCALAIKEAAVYRYQGNNYVVYFPRENPEIALEIYAHGCDSFDRFCEGATCNDLVTEGTLLEVIYSTEDCPDDNDNTNNKEEIFEKYAWLTSLVNPTTCSTEKIAVYQTGSYQYLLITDATGIAKLYNEDGQFYCQNASNYDCVAAYNLGAPIDSWTCGDVLPTEGCRANIGTLFFRTCGNGQLFYLIETEDGRLLDYYLDASISYEAVDGQRVYFEYQNANFSTPCSIAERAVNISCIEVAENNPQPDSKCTNYSGVIVSELCDDGTSYFFIDADYGRKLDAYLAAGIDYTFKAGQRVNFNFEPAAFTTPCSSAFRAVIVTCIENEATTVGDNSAAIFNTYAWLRAYVNPSNCNGKQVTVYQSGAYQYIFIESATGGQLYFQDGTFYCQDAPGYDCRSAYNLTTITDSWTCSNFRESNNDERAKADAEQLDLSLFPNPTTGRFTIQVIPNLKQEQQLRVVDLFGRVLVREVIQPGVSQLNVDLSDYQNGVYYLELRAKGQRLIKRVIKHDLD